MASTCVNHIGISPDSFLESPSSKCKSYAWLSPRKSFTRQYPPQKDSEVHNGKQDKQTPHPVPEPDLEDEFGDFEFRLEDNFTMLPADELFFNGKLVPLQLSMRKQSVVPSEPTRSSATFSRKEISIMDPYLFSPKAPRCTTRWKELLGLRKLYQKEKENNLKSSNSSTATKSLKNLLSRSSRSPMSSSFDNLPLLKDDIAVSSSRLSLSSSSSSGHEHEDIPRHSLDTDKKHNALPRVSTGSHQKAARRSTSSEFRVKSATRRQTDADAVARMDSPRMNASGKIIFQSLERSSSSPSSYGGPRYKHSSSVQRSYSANVRVTPVLNVPVCSKSGAVFGLFASSSSHPKRDTCATINASSSSKGTHHTQGTKPRKNRN